MSETRTPGHVTMSARPEGQPRPSRGVIAVLPYLLDFIVPLVAFYALTAAGVSPFWSLTIGGALTGVVSVVNTIRRGRLDGLGLLVIAEIALGLVLITTTRDPRLVLARSSLYVALAGIWVLASAVIGRPVTISSSKAFAARREGQDGIAAVDWLAANSASFLHIHRRLSALWGGMFLLYAVVRVVIIYSTSVSRAVSISEIPGIIAIGVCLIASRQAGQRLETLANERLRESGGRNVCLRCGWWGRCVSADHDRVLFGCLRVARTISVCTTGRGLPPTPHDHAAASRACHACGRCVWWGLGASQNRNVLR